MEDYIMLGIESVNDINFMIVVEKNMYGYVL